MKVNIRNERAMNYGMEVLVTADCPLMREVLYSHFKVQYPNWYMIKKRNPKIRPDWDKCKDFARKTGDPCEVIIPFGLMHLLEGFCEEHNLPKPSFDELVESRKVEYGDYVQGIVLDPVQVEVCKEMCDNPLCSVELETASGKTEIICNLCACAISSAFKTEPFDEYIVVIVPDIQILSQTKAKLEERLPGFPIGMVGDGIEDLNKPIVVTTFASACRDERLNWRQKWKTIIVDEAHHSNAPQWKNALTTAYNLQRLWAFSGKLSYVEDVIKQRELECMFGPPIVRGKNEERLCPVNVLIYDSPEWKKNFKFKGKLYSELTNGMPVDVIRKRGEKSIRAFWHSKQTDDGNPNPVTMDDYVLRNGKYLRITADLDPPRQEDECIFSRSEPGIFIDGERVEQKPYYSGYHVPRMKGIAEYVYRSEWGVELARQAAVRGEPFLISVSSIFVVDYVTALCQRAGLKVAPIFGGNEKNDATINNIKQGKLQGAVGEYSKLSEGLDIPNLVHFIKLDGIVSEEKLEQQKGRVQRIAAGKEVGYLHIPADTHLNALSRKVRKMEKYFQAISGKSNLTVRRVKWGCDDTLRPMTGSSS